MSTNSLHLDLLLLELEHRRAQVEVLEGYLRHKVWENIEFRLQHLDEARRALEDLERGYQTRVAELKLKGTW